MKRILCLFLVMITLILSSAPLNALAKDRTLAPVSEENPFYEGREVYSDGEYSIQGGADSTVYYPLGNRLYKTVKDKLMSRAESFTLYYSLGYELKSKAAVIAVMDSLLAGATEDSLSTGSTDGDYLRWSVKSFGASTTSFDKKEGGSYYYTSNITVSYYTTSAQEKKVSDVITAFIKSINPANLSDYQKALKVHNFICSKAKYDTNAENDIANYPTAFTAYGALVEGKAVCQGYASAFYRICKELGLNVRFVSSSATKGKHAWNMLELDEKYYFVDCTWDDINSDEKSGNPRQYFLKSYDTVRADDSEDKEHTLDEKYYSTDYFNSKYLKKLDESDYDIANLRLFSRCIVLYKFESSNALPTVYIRNEELIPLKEGRDYKVSYGLKGTSLGRGKYSDSELVFTLADKASKNPALNVRQAN